MNNFDKRCNQLLNEITLGGIAKGVGKFAKEVVKQAPGAVGSAINAAQNPGEGIKNVIGGIKGKYQEYKENKKLPFSRKNPPKVGQIVQVEAGIHGIKPLNKGPNKFQTYEKVPGAVVIGQITQKMDMATGLFGVGLRDQIGPNKFDKSRKLVFDKTKDKNYWQVFDRANAFDPAYSGFLVDFRDPLAKSGIGGITVGALSTEVSPELKMWTDFKQFMDQKIGEKRK